MARHSFLSLDIIILRNVIGKFSYLTALLFGRFGGGRRAVRAFYAANNAACETYTEPSELMMETTMLLIRVFFGGWRRVEKVG